MRGDERALAAKMQKGHLNYSNRGRRAWNKKKKKKGYKNNKIKMAVFLQQCPRV